MAFQSSFILFKSSTQSDSIKMALGAHGTHPPYTSQALLPSRGVALPPQRRVHNSRSSLQTDVCLSSFLILAANDHAPILPNKFQFCFEWRCSKWKKKKKPFPMLHALSERLLSSKLVGSHSSDFWGLSSLAHNCCWIVFHRRISQSFSLLCSWPLTYASDFSSYNYGSEHQSHWCLIRTKQKRITLRAIEVISGCFQHIKKKKKKKSQRKARVCL